MAKTLEEAGGRTETGVLPVSSAITSSVNIASPNIKVAGDSLSKDLLSIIGGVGAIVKEKNTLSVKAAERVARDSLSQMSIEMEELKASAQPDSDIDELKASYEAVYQTNGRKTFDNEDAQRAFDRAYHTRGAEATAGILSNLTQVGMKRDHEALVVNTENDISKQIDAGVIQDSEAVEGYRDTMGAGGYLTQDQIDGKIVKILNVGLNKRHQINKNLQIYTNGRIDAELQAKEFNKVYGGMMTMDENGNITKVGNTSDEAMQNGINSWKSLVLKDKDNNTKYNRKWEEVMNASTNAESNAKSGYSTPQQITQRINELDEAAQNAVEFGDSTAEAGVVTAKKKGDYIKKRNDLINQMNVSKLVQNDIFNPNIRFDEVKGYLQNGKNVELNDANLVSTTGGTIDTHIPASYYQAAMSKYQEELSEVLTEIPLDNPDNVTAFNNQLSTLKRVENISGKKSQFSEQFDAMFDPKETTTSNGLDDIKRLNAYTAFMAKDNPYYQKQISVVNKLDAELNKLKEDGSNIVEVELGAYNIIQQAKIDETVKTNNKSYQLGINAALDTIKSGALFAQGTFFDSEVAPNTTKAISSWLYANNVAPEFSENHIVKNLEFYDYGTVNLFGQDDVRIVRPKGTTSRSLNSAINVTLKDYNKTNSTGFTQDDTYPTSKYNKSTDDFIIEIYSRETNEFIGRIDATNTQILKSKEQ